MAFTLDTNLDHAAACGAIGQALAARQITAAEAGAALAAWDKNRAAGASNRPRFTRTAKGAVYFRWGKSGEGVSRSVTTDKAGWEAIGKVAAEILKTWDKIPLSRTAKLSPEERERRKQAYLERKGEKPAVRQVIEYTDFFTNGDTEFRLWAAPVDEQGNWVIMLPSEY